MSLKLYKSSIENQKTVINITGSKSESNRLLLLQALYPKITIANLSNSEDTQLMQKALASKSEIIDVHHAGTAMRFLTAYFSIQNNRNVIVTGSSRMQERPIKILVDALRNLGANISYGKSQGFPPLKIKGKALQKNKIQLNANVSSQYISALMLIAPKLKNGLEIILEGEITSLPYIKMTLSLLNQIGVETYFNDNRIKINPYYSNGKAINLTVESDWSSASYFYSIVALSSIGTEIHLSSYKKKSLQGDAILADIYKDFGVETQFYNESITIIKARHYKHKKVHYNLNNAPDIAQTITVTCFGLGIRCKLSGLHTLKIKETDRLVALQTELTKLGAEVKITEDTIQFNKRKNITENVDINTYNDHRMAMAFAPLGLKTTLQINNPEVVTKSYPNYWNDLSAIGFKIKK